MGNTNMQQTVLWTRLLTQNATSFAGHSDAASACHRLPEQYPIRRLGRGSGLVASSHAARGPSAELSLHDPAAEVPGSPRVRGLCHSLAVPQITDGSSAYQ